MQGDAGMSPADHGAREQEQGTAAKQVEQEVEIGPKAEAPALAVARETEGWQRRCRQTWVTIKSVKHTHTISVLQATHT